MSQITLPIRQQLAHQTWQTCLSLLPPQIGSNLITYSDGDEFKKNGGQVKIARIQILPRSKSPVSFWSKKSCFYELGVGMYERSQDILGGVMFLQFSNQKACGSGHYFQPVLDVLHTAQRKRPADFFVGTYNDEGAQMPQLTRRYRATPVQKSFPVELAARDLAWLIERTLPSFECLPSL